MIALVGLGATACGAAVAAPVPPRAHAANYLYTSIGDFDADARPLLGRPDIDGVQVLVPWGALEKERNHYDFTAVEQVAREVDAQHKKLFLQLQDRFFQLPARVPDYLLTDPKYAGGVASEKDDNGLTSGAVAAQWNDNVRDRFQHLLKALAHRFDGRIAGLNLPESSVEVDTATDKTHFTCDTYFDAELDNMAYARKVFRTSAVVQYINFWPCGWANDNGYLARSFAFAREDGIGVGGPDLLPYNKPHMTNSYRFLNQYRGQLGLVAMAVQEPDFGYVNPGTGKKYTRQEFVDFADDYLGADIIFWATSSPWLHQDAGDQRVGGNSEFPAGAALTGRPSPARR